jgi:hypothetical protein
MRQASVVDLPEPVGPVTSTMPRGRDASSSMARVSPIASGSGIFALMTRNTASTPLWVLTTLTRKRENPGTAKEQSSSQVVSKRVRCSSESME